MDIASQALSEIYMPSTRLLKALGQAVQVRLVAPRRLDVEEGEDAVHVHTSWPASKASKAEGHAVCPAGVCPKIRITGTCRSSLPVHLDIVQSPGPGLAKALKAKQGARGLTR